MGIDSILGPFESIFGSMAGMVYGLYDEIIRTAEMCDSGLEFLCSCLFTPHMCFPILCLLGTAFNLFYLIFILPMDCFKRVIRAPKLGGGKRK